MRLDGIEARLISARVGTIPPAMHPNQVTTDCALHHRADSCGRGVGRGHGPSHRGTGMRTLSGEVSADRFCFTPVSASFQTTLWNPDGNTIGAEWGYNTGSGAGGFNSGIGSSGLDIFGQGNFGCGGSRQNVGGFQWGLVPNSYAGQKIGGKTAPTVIANTGVFNLTISGAPLDLGQLGCGSRHLKQRSQLQWFRSRRWYDAHAVRRRSGRSCDPAPEDE